MKPFVHLHLHTEYSLLDGMATISKVVKKAKKLNMPAIAMTDHGNMYGAVQFYDTCKKEGVKGIFGTEFYVCDDLTVKGKLKTADVDGYKDRRHLVLLAKNQTGYKNLCLLNAIAFRDGYYYKPRIDLKTLSEHTEGLVCLSACIGGDIPQAILRHDLKKAEELLTTSFNWQIKDDEMTGFVNEDAFEIIDNLCSEIDRLQEILEEQKEYYENQIRDCYKPISPYEFYGVNEDMFH